jgi:Fe-S oxidoreductase
VDEAADLLSVPLSILLSIPWAERALLPPMSAESPQGTGTIADCTKKQLIEADACIECGRCKKLCSIYQGGIPFAPVTLMKNLRDLMRRGSRSIPLAGSAIDKAALWSCTACRSCEERCPMNGEHASGIVEIRRGEIERKQAPEFAEARFTGNKASLASAADRFKLPDCNSDVYIWPGCREGNADQGVTLQSVLKLMKRAGLTATVLEPPSCCGGPIRRLGNETLFRQDAMANIAYLKAIEGATIITCCPHCVNTLKNEYPRLGASFRVMHHTQYLAGLLEAGKLPAAKSIPLKATFHDPCFLGRYNDEYSSPRKLLRSMEGLLLLEMKHSRQKSFCCGSGGGTAPPEVAAANGRKWIRQALKEGVEAVITGCPYCRENLVAAAREEHPDRALRIMDVVEILIEEESVKSRSKAKELSLTELAEKGNGLMRNNSVSCVLKRLAGAGERQQWVFDKSDDSGGMHETSCNQSCPGDVAVPHLCGSGADQRYVWPYVHAPPSDHQGSGGVATRHLHAVYARSLAPGGIEHLAR